MKHLLKWTPGIKSTLQKHNAYLRDPYSWLGHDNKGKFVYIIEADHRDKISVINLKEGFVTRNMNAAKNSWHPITIRHSEEVLDSLGLAFSVGVPVKVMLTKNTKYSENPKGQIKAMFLPWDYTVTEFTGTNVYEKYFFRLEIIEEGKYNV